MNDRFDDKPLKAEVIDMDRMRKARSRPSAIFSERVETAIGSGPDDPGYRYLFDDLDDRNPRRGAKTLRKVRSLVLTVVIAMGSAWVVWTVPGFGPQQHQAMLMERLQASETRLGELESSLAQAQARVIELTRTAEIQNSLIDQGESLRRSMTTSLEKLAENSKRIADEQSAVARRIESIETAARNTELKVRQQADSIAGLDSAVIEGLTRVQFANERNERRIQEIRRDAERGQRETYFELTRFVQDELAAMRQGDLTDVRQRVERLAGHVWQEVGRLDGRIVRMAVTPDATVVR